MRFFGIVTLAIALLQREGRITYRALRRGFELDDASLEDLRRDLSEAKRAEVLARVRHHLQDIERRRLARVAS